MPNATADAPKEHLKFDSSLTGNGDNLGLAICNYGLSPYQQFIVLKKSSRVFVPKQESFESQA